MKNASVSWKIEGIFKANAQKCYEEISKLNRITPEDILNQAKDINSELHKCFEWDDTIAANKYRLQQARQVIQFLVVTPAKREVYPQRIFQITTEKNVYQPTQFFIQNKDEYQNLLKRALGELKAFKERYKQLTELEDIFKVIESL